MFKHTGKARQKRKPRSMWVRQWWSEQRREKYVHYSTLLKELRTEDETSFYNYTRLPRALYDELLHRIEGKIKKKDTWYRKSLRPSLKLSITLRHLACGDSYWSLSYYFRVAPNTISLIIHEVCDAIKAEFAAEVIQCPTSKEEWSSIAEQFETRWQFPHCCGALDDKHVAVTCPWNTGSMYRNYKDFFSIFLMALVDADCMFFCGLVSDLMIPATTPVFIMDQNWRKVLRFQTIHFITLKISPYPVMTFLSLISL